MAEFSNETYTEQRIQVDGNRYVQCQFVQCTLVYSGGGMPAFDRCNFQNTGLLMEGAARNTKDYLRTLYSQGLITNVNGVIEDIKTGTLAFSNRPQPCPPRYTGTNFAGLAAAVGVMAVLTLIIMGFVWFGFLYSPQEQVLMQNEPLRVEIPLDVMPVLPESLAEVYDNHLGDQLLALGEYGWVDEANGVARIPLDQAMQMVAEDGEPSW